MEGNQNEPEYENTNITNPDDFSITIVDNTIYDTYSGEDTYESLTKTDNHVHTGKEDSLLKNNLYDNQALPTNSHDGGLNGGLTAPHSLPSAVDSADKLSSKGGPNISVSSCTRQLRYIIIGVVIGLLIVIVVVVCIVLFTRKREDESDDMTATAGLSTMAVIGTLSTTQMGTVPPVITHITPSPTYRSTSIPSSASGILTSRIRTPIFHTGTPSQTNMYRTTANILTTRVIYPRTSTYIPGRPSTTQGLVISR